MAARNYDKKDEFSFEIKEHLCTLGEAYNGWTKEFNLVSWNGTNPKFDIREWSPDHSRMTKGITFSREEMAKVKEVLALAV